MIQTRKKLLLFALLEILLALTHSLENRKQDGQSIRSNYNVKKNAEFSAKTKRSVHVAQSVTENTTDYYLPDNVIPREYYIRLTPFILPSNSTFNGKVKIIADVMKTTSKIVLHADLDIRNVAISSINDDLSSIRLEITKITKTEKYQFLNLISKSPIRVGTKISIEISYTGTLNSQSVGFFKTSYKFKNETRYGF